MGFVFVVGIIFHGTKSQQRKIQLKLAFYTPKNEGKWKDRSKGQREREMKVEQHNLCSDGDYVLQKQMIKGSRKRLMSVCLLRRMLLQPSEKKSAGSLEVVM